MLASGSSDNIVRVYVTPAAAPSSPSALQQQFPTSNAPTRLAHTFTGHMGKSRAWPLRAGYCAKTLMAFSACMDVAIGDYSAATLVSAHLDGKVRVWDSESGGMGAEVVVARGQGRRHPSTIVTLARDNAIRVIDLRSQTIVNSIHSPGGGFVAAGAVDGSVFGWDMRTKEQTIVTGGHGTQVNEVSWNPYDPSQMYSIDKSGTVSVWGL
ncbi:WD40-repeat-containing domain protein [Catenaria anguillulae PL171]|uniref:WD40-repeat-containing domain protein n=1 Tax=Catenaria anguillulae PL171 TaxID=765915 RepID=A0A1Y2HMP4_9FUNG|nr:WD40-repeat-containing domain protein [Catenaria anguillulae PL171]